MHNVSRLIQIWKEHCRLLVGLDSPAGGDRNLLCGVSASCANLFNLLYNLHTFHNFSEDYVMVVELKKSIPLRIVTR